MHDTTVAYFDWKWSTTSQSGRSRSTPRWKPLSIEGFTPLSTSPVATRQIATFSLGSVGTHEPVPDTSASSPMRHEMLPLEQSVSPASPTRWAWRRNSCI